LKGQKVNGLIGCMQDYSSSVTNIRRE